MDTPGTEHPVEKVRRAAHEERPVITGIHLHPFHFRIDGSRRRNTRENAQEQNLFPAGLHYQILLSKYTPMESISERLGSVQSSFHKALKPTL